MRKLQLLIWTLMWASGILSAQDKIYYKKNKTDNWKVTEINPQYIKAVDASDSETGYSITPSDVLFVFNKAGDFLVIPDMYDKKKNVERNTKNFFKKGKSVFNDYDKIITDENEIIICKYLSDDAKRVNYMANSKNLSISKSEVALIVFKSGEHRILSPVEKVYKVLNVIQDKYSELALTDYDEKAAEKDSALAATATPDSAKLPELEGPPARSGASSVSASQELPPATLLKLQDKAKTNIRQLGDYIQIICQKDSDPDEVSKTIGQALALFVDGAKIEVSSLNRTNVIQYNIKDYLIRLGMLKYDKVIIQWSKIQYTSTLRKGPDGLYYGTVEFEQRFMGISGDNQTYEDITRKTVEVVLRPYERNTGGGTTIEWDVFLGDIGVTVTKHA
jgi:hypothetical protein